jgi:HlyD family secretion protein
MKLPRVSRRLGTILLAALGVAGVVLVVRLLQHRGAAPSPVPVVTVGRQDVSVTIEATGTVEPINLVEVKSKASGQILRLLVDVGSQVKVGDLLAQIDPVDVKNQYTQALATLRAAQVKVDISGAQKKRADDLYAQQVTTADEHESATLDYANSEAQLVKARTDLDIARQRRDDATVRAPVAGTVLEKLVSAGQVISSATSSVSGGTSLLKMADLSRIRLRALVSETDIGSVRPGQPATVTVDAFPQRPFQGEVEKIEPQAVVQQSITMFPVLISISNEGGLLLPGMNGQVSMLVDQREGALAVPIDAVRTGRELPAVAAALGMNVDSLRAQLQRQQEARRAAGVAAGYGSGMRADSGSGMRAGSGSGARAGSGSGARAGFGTGAAAGRGPGTRPRYGSGTAAGSGSGARAGSGSGAGAGSGSGTAAGTGTSAGAGTGSAARANRAQFVFVKTAAGLELRLVRLGLTDFDYAEVLGGVKEGDEVALLSVAELQAKRKADQARIAQRIGSGVPGVPGAGGAGAGAGRATGGGR